MKKSVNLALALEEIRKMVEPMGGIILSRVEMIAEEQEPIKRNYCPTMTFTVAFEAERLSQYISQAYQPDLCTAHKSGDETDCSSLKEGQS
jgi:predicted Zn-dependent peptidase